MLEPQSQTILSRASEWSLLDSLAFAAALTCPHRPRGSHCDSYESHSPLFLIGPCDHNYLHERTAAVSGRVKKREDLCFVNVAADC